MVDANVGHLAPPPPPPPPPPPFNPRPQSHYFYTARWTKWVDMAFIQALYYKAIRGQKQLSRQRVCERVPPTRGANVERVDDDLCSARPEENLDGYLAISSDEGESTGDETDDGSEDGGSGGSTIED
ncbi:hypothetical protein Salat_0254400 [Sesamum alatum]|uniref:Uncharacterized protein n=1 Tax=Sesamum alatum TaxID=300844 RepID=A0AAE1YYV5_9LAMI|nr:hypothetical protein Salat_0254400 [Sesamum alatum]